MSVGLVQTIYNDVRQTCDNRISYMLIGIAPIYNVPVCVCHIEHRSHILLNLYCNFICL